MSVMGRNVKLMKQMESWTPEEAKKARNAFPLGGSGRSMSKNPRPGTVSAISSGIKPKVRAAAFQVIARSRAARRAAGQKKK